MNTLPVEEIIPPNITADRFVFAPVGGKEARLERPQSPCRTCTDAVLPPLPERSSSLGRGFLRKGIYNSSILELSRSTIFARSKFGLIGFEV